MKIIIPEYDQVAEHLRRPQSYETGEQMLCHAVIEQAVKERDGEWISDTTAYSHEWLTFEFCCQVLSLSVSKVRSELLKRFSTAEKRVAYTRTWTRSVLTIEDVPGKNYSHLYGECPPGMALSRCPECMQRYNHAYRKNRQNAA